MVSADRLGIVVFPVNVSGGLNKPLIVTSKGACGTNGWAVISAVNDKPSDE